MSTSTKFSGREIEVRTLTVRDVKELLDEIKNEGRESKSVLDLHVLDLLFDDDVPARAIAKSTGLSLEELSGNITPEEVHGLIDKVRAENPFFVGMMERLVSAGKGAERTNRAPSSKPLTS